MITEKRKALIIAGATVAGAWIIDAVRLSWTQVDPRQVRGLKEFMTQTLVRLEALESVLRAHHPEEYEAAMREAWARHQD